MLKRLSHWIVLILGPRMFRRSAISIGLVFLFCHCASAPVPREVARTAVYGASFDDTWTALIDLFGEAYYPIGTIEKDSGLISTEWFIPPRGQSYLDCGKPGFGTFSNPTGKFNVIVREIPTGTEIVVNSMWRGMRGIGNDLNRIQCVSTGALEREIHQELRERLQQ